jgi:hypothetical protein
MSVRDTNQNKSEVHSQKIRRLLEDFPNKLTRLNIIVIAIILISLITVICIMPYPDSGEKSILQYYLELVNFT